MSGSRDDYDIGYRKPPHWSRFKAGQSGNPGGRPPKSRAKDPDRPEKGSASASHHYEMLQREYRREVTVQENGRPTRVSMENLVAKAQLNAAAKGNPIAQKEVMRQARELGIWEEEEKRLAALAQEAEEARKRKIYDYIVGFKKKRAAAWIEAEALGQEPDPVWPHPDDILIFPERKEWKVRGPLSAESLPFYSFCRGARDYYFALASLKRRLKQDLSRAEDELNILFWVSFDVMLPLRWQRAHDHEEWLWHYHWMPLAELETVTSELERQYDELKRQAGVPAYDKDVCRQTNMIMKPLLKHYGYRSLAEFEHAFELHGENMPWPKKVEARERLLG